jgi:ankyrin repeat protein
LIRTRLLYLELLYLQTQGLDKAVVNLLVEKGAELESKASNGRTPLSWAAGNGREEVVKLLVEKGAKKSQ